jgi:hypothetical protein
MVPPPLLAACAPRRLFLTYFNVFLRRDAWRVLTVVELYFNLDISDKPTAAAWLSRNRPQALATAPSRR